MGKGDKNTRVKDWNKYWAEYDQIFKKDKEIVKNEHSWYVISNHQLYDELKCEKCGLEIYENEKNEVLPECK